jgi:hypothetical protein
MVFEFVSRECGILGWAHLSKSTAVAERNAKHQTPSSKEVPNLNPQPPNQIPGQPAGRAF